MPELPEVSQDWSADSTKFVAGLQAAIDAAKAFDQQLRDSMVTLGEFQAALDALDDVKTVDIDTRGVPEDIAEVEALRAELDSLPHEETVHVDVDVEAAKAFLESFIESLNESDRVAADASRGMDDYKSSVDALARAMDGAEAAERGLTREGGDINSLFEVTAKTAGVMDEAMRTSADAADVLRRAEDALGDSGNAGLDRAAKALEDIGAASTTSKGPVASWLSTWKNVIHWVIAGSAEFLAVAIPAMVAFGSYALVALQGFNNMSNHLQALYTVQESTAGIFGKTAGDILGVGHAIQAAQNAVNPQVYQLLGAYVDVASKHLTNLAAMGEKTSGVIDTFTAKAALDMKGAFGSELNDLISGATSDLTGLGEVFGNLGHTILNVAHSMPGLAEVLLRGLADVLGVASRITSIPWVQTMGLWTMATEEFYRWGGLAVSALTKLFHVSDYANAQGATGFISKFGAGFNALVHGAGNATIRLGTFMGRAAGVSEHMGTLGTKIAQVGGDIAGFADKLSPLQGALIALGVAGLGFLIYKLVTAKSAAQEFAQSLQQALQAVSNFQAAGQIADNIGALNTKMHEAAQGAQAMTSAQANSARALERVNQGANVAKEAISTYQGALGQAHGEEVTLASGAAAIEKQYGVSYPAALAIAEGANVKLADSTVKFGHDMNTAGQQITDYVKGMRAMGAPTGAIGNDLKAVGIQAAETQTKVAQLNQAWDAFMQGVTGGTGAFSDMETALGNMKTDTAASSAGITGAISSIKNAAGGMTYSLKGDTAASQQSWQQFDQALGSSAENLADWFRTAGSEGQMGAGQFTRAIKDMVAQFAPLTQGNKAAVSELSALAQQAGGPSTSSLKTLEGWVGHTGNASKSLQGIIADVTGKMADMSKVAQNLGDVLDSQVDSAIAGNIMKQSGLNQAISTYASDLDTLGPKNQATVAALHRMQQAYNTAASDAAHASQATAGFGDAASTAGGKANAAARAIDNYISALDHIPSRVETEVVTNYTSTGYSGPGGVGHRVGAHGGMVGSYGIIPSFAGGGVIPGFSPGNDNMLAALSAGESILNPYATRALGADTINWLNAAAWHGGGSAGGGAVSGPSAGGGQVAQNHVHVYLDGKEIYASVKQQNYVYGTRNSGQRAGLMTPGTRT